MMPAAGIYASKEDLLAASKKAKPYYNHFKLARRDKDSLGDLARNASGQSKSA